MRGCSKRLGGGLTSGRMLDPRIYRTGLIIGALAVIVFAFSLHGQPGPLSTSMSPVAFNGANSFRWMQSLAAQYPTRSPGSYSDDALADVVAEQFNNSHLFVTTSTVRARTVDGPQTLETVLGTLAGPTSGSIVVVAHRDALGSPAEAELSGTATLIELARDLSAETHHHTIVLASISGSAGSAGAAALAQELPGPIDAVIVLGDLAGEQVHQPTVVPWSDSLNVAPPVLRNTVGVGAQRAGVGAVARSQPAGAARSPCAAAHARRAGAVRRARPAGGAAVAVR